MEPPGNPAWFSEWGVENQGLQYSRRHAVDVQGNVYVPFNNDLRVLKYSFE
jgi:hypothetical protein